MTWFELLLTIHILAAIVWLGGAIMLLALGYSLKNADAQARADFTRMTEKVPTILFVVASIIVIIAGSLMVADQEAYEFSQAWVTIGYVGWFVSFAIGIGFYGPEGKRRERAIEAEGVQGPTVLKSLNRVLTVATIDTLIITLVVIDMVAKPGL